MQLDNPKQLYRSKPYGRHIMKFCPCVFHITPHKKCSAAGNQQILCSSVSEKFWTQWKQSVCTV